MKTLKLEAGAQLTGFCAGLKVFYCSLGHEEKWIPGGQNSCEIYSYTTALQSTKPELKNIWFTTAKN